MPKLKSHSGAKKRFKKSASGKWRHHRAGRRHLFTPSSGKHAQFKRSKNSLSKGEARFIDIYLPYS